MKVCMPLRSLVIFEDKRQQVQVDKTVLQDIPPTQFSETCMHDSSLLRFFAKTGTTVYDKNIVGSGFEEEHQHEEADTPIPYRALVADSEYPGRQICVSSPDTDVFIL